MDSFFPSYCSVCDKTIEGCNGLYCSNVCRMRDSMPGQDPIYHQSSTIGSTHNKKHSSISSSRSLSLHYPSVFSATPLSPSHLNSFSDIPKSLPDLSLSEDEEPANDEFDIPELSLQFGRGLPILRYR